jgi:hypothetical protein
MGLHMGSIVLSILVLKANPKQLGFLVINVWLDAIDFIFLGVDKIRVQRK